jgi:nucleoid DNA-binding protein
MTRKEISRIIAEETGIPQPRVLEIVQQVLDGIIEALVQEGGIELRNFGVFEVRKCKARQARNPRTGERLAVPERFGIRFRPGREMLERIRQSTKVK